MFENLNKLKNSKKIERIVKNRFKIINKKRKSNNFRHRNYYKSFEN